MYQFSFQSQEPSKNCSQPKQTACHLFIGVEVDANKHLKKNQKIKKRSFLIACCIEVCLCVECIINVIWDFSLYYCSSITRKLVMIFKGKNKKVQYLTASLKIPNGNAVSSKTANSTTD